jgi:hypothetical protein
MTRLLLCLLVLGPAWASAQVIPSRAPQAPAVSPPGVDAASAKRTLASWFRGYEFVPTAADYQRLGPRLGPALVGLAEDTGLALTARARAVSAMTYAHDAATLGHLTGLLDAPSQPSILRRKAALALGQRAAEAAVSPLVDAFAGAGHDVFLREACARALRGIGPPAHAARETLFAIETAPSVRALLREGKQITGTHR